MTTTIRIDGLEYEVEAKTAAAYEKSTSALKGRIDELEARADKAEGERDAAQTELTETKTKLDEAIDPKRTQEAVRARVELEKKARKIVGDEVKLDGTDREIKILVMKQQDEKFDAEGRSDAYIDGRFDVIVEAAPERRDARDETRTAVAGAPGGSPLPSKDTKDDPRLDSADAARKAAEKAARERGRAPLRSTRKHGTAN